jgi:hypothetical protein
MTQQTYTHDEVQALIAAAYRAAADAVEDTFPGTLYLSNMHKARAAILALTPQDAAAALDRAVSKAREVKPLAWSFWSQGTLAGADAQSVFGLYQIRSQPAAGIHRLYLGTELIAEGDYTDLKPAALADYTARILAALEDKP